MTFKKEVAKKVLIKHLLDGEYIKKGGWEPNYIYTCQGEATKVSLIAFVVTKISDNHYLVDDGTGSLPIRIFDTKSQFMIGDLVNIIGRPKEWNKKKYVVPEIIQKLENKNWLIVRQKELGIIKKSPVKQPVALEIDKNVGPYQQMLELISESDKGSGADQSILLSAGIKNAQEVINSLIEEGEIYQITPGKYKILD